MTLQTSIVPATCTKDALTFPVDYNDVTAVDPPSSAVFCSQASITKFLSKRGVSNFKNLQAVWNALPYEIRHTVTINVAAGVTRPRTGETGSSAWKFDSKMVMDAGSVVINGALPSTWTAVDPAFNSLHVDSFQAANDDPWLDFSVSHPGIFAGQDLRGAYVVLSTGQVTVIHDHTDTRLYVMASLSPSPAGATVKIAHPSTILRNSLNDTGYAYLYDMRVDIASNQATNTVLTLQNIRYQALGASFGLNNTRAGTFARLQRFEFDAKTFNATTSTALSVGYFGRFICSACSLLGNDSWSAANLLTVYALGKVNLSQTYARGWSYGLSAYAGSEILLVGAVLDRCSAPSTVAAVKINGGIFGPSYGSGGKQNEIRNSFAGGMFFNQISNQDVYSLGQERGLHIGFRNCVGPCVIMRSNANLFAGSDDNISNEFVTSRFVDLGGNQSVGLDYSGRDSKVFFGNRFLPSGALGDIRFKDGAIMSWSDATAAQPIVDRYGNVLSRL